MKGRFLSLYGLLFCLGAGNKVHMADVLVSPAVGGAMWAATAGVTAYSVKKIKNDLDDKKISQGYHRAIEIEKEILGLTKNITENRKLDMAEFINSAKGVALMNAACLVLMKYEYKRDEVELVFEGKSLAEALEHWFESFSSLWRIRNKESELYRINDTIACLCRFLRDTTLNKA